MDVSSVPFDSFAVWLFAVAKVLLASWPRSTKLQKQTLVFCICPRYLALDLQHLVQIFRTAHTHTALLQRSLETKQVIRLPVGEATTFFEGSILGFLYYMPLYALL